MHKIRQADPITGEHECILRRSVSTASFYHLAWAAGWASCSFSLDIRLLLAYVWSQTNRLMGQHLYRDPSPQQHLRSHSGSDGRHRSGLQLDREMWTNVNGRDSSRLLKDLQHKLHITEAVSGQTGRTEHELYKWICLFNIRQHCDRSCLSVCLFVSVIVLCAIFECRIKFRAALLYLFVLCVCLPVCLNGVDGRKPLWLLAFS